MVKICFYSPESHVEAIKKALFDAGAGQQGDYDHCSWQTMGQGQFRPLEGSSPYLGKVDEFEIVREIKVEMVCQRNKIKATIEALILAHPYEEPSYQVTQVLLAEDFE